MKIKERFTALRERIRRRLGSRAGETIAETMISVLVAALSLVMLAGAVSAASNNIAKSRDKMNTYYSQNETLVKMSGSGQSARVTITFGGKSWESEDIACYENGTFAADPVIAYKRQA